MTARDTFLRCVEASVGGDYCTPPREPGCTDCSGLVARCYREATGQTITGDSHRQYELGRVVSGGLRPSDLLFFDTGYSHRGNAASHVGVWVGNGQMVNALNEDAGIVSSTVDTSYWRARRLGARRLFDDAGNPLPEFGGALPEPPVPAASTSIATDPKRDRDGRGRGRLRQRIVDAWRRRRRR